MMKVIVSVVSARLAVPLALWPVHFACVAATVRPTLLGVAVAAGGVRLVGLFVVLSVWGWMILVGGVHNLPAPVAVSVMPRTLHVTASPRGRDSAAVPTTPLA